MECGGISAGTLIILRQREQAYQREKEVKPMQNKKWKKFDKLTEKCYNNMAGLEQDGSCWQQAFALLKEIVREERQADPSCMSQLEMVDDATDYEHSVQEWVEDCLDTVDMRKDYETLLRMCDDLLELFGWPDYSGSDIKFVKASALASLGRNQKAVEYCRKWIQKEPENIVASAAGVYALIGTKEYAEAEKLVDQFILNPCECTEETDIMFTAASRLYEAMGKKKEKKQIDKAMKEYEKRLEEEIFNSDWDEEEYSFGVEEDDGLPF